MRLWILLIVLAALLGGCKQMGPVVRAPEEKSSTITTVNSEHYPVTIDNYESDRKKVKLTFYKKPERVMVHHQNIIEAMIAIGEEDRIVAAGFTGTDNKIFSPEYAEKVKKLPVVGDWNIDLESVMYAQPDLMIGWQSSFTPRMLKDTYYWHKRGVNTYIAANSNNVLKEGTIEDECRFINDLGEIFDKKSVTDKLVKEIRDELKSVKEKVKGRKQPRVLILELLGKNMWNYDKTRLAGNMVTQLGGELIECGRNVSIEQLIELNPDVIFVVCATGQNKALFVDKLYNDPVYHSINAVVNKRVYPVQFVYLYVSGTRTIDGIRAFRDGLYPDLKDHDPAEVGQKNKD